MNIQLPPRTDGQPAGELRDVRQITIIGANGSGKTRFCNAVASAGKGGVFRMSALRALYEQHDATAALPGSIDAMFTELNNSSTSVKSTAATEFERLTIVMMAEEFRELMNWKTLRYIDDPNAPAPVTKLDTVVKVWQEVFPGNKVLRENGTLMFATEGHGDRYASARLSDGEKAVLYYVGAVLYAMPNALIIVDDPETFLHRSIMVSLWNVIEGLRSDCTFIYATHDVDFATSRSDNACIWVKAYDPDHKTWDYEVSRDGSELGDALFVDLLGSRKPVLFIEGDATHSIDARLYPLVFSDYTVKPLGSCNRVIESVRTFGSLQSMHHLDSRGIVDRDRRTDREVGYLRDRKVMVPDVAEVENLFMLEPVLEVMACRSKRNAERIVERVKAAVFDMFTDQLKAQALEHVRHRVKTEVEHRIDQRFRNINALEDHMVDLVNEIRPRAMYNAMCREFRKMVDAQDYAGVLRVFNHKQMIAGSGVAQLLGLGGKDGYIKAVLKVLRDGGRDADTIRQAIKRCFEVAQPKS
ncbi:MAG: DUF4435 domain-containing protein [Muribaculaceae bacterium]|nr:DUF4435 domain-containing protein [Muribaculaceae bacterium]